MAASSPQQQAPDGTECHAALGLTQAGLELFIVDQLADPLPLAAARRRIEGSEMTPAQRSALGLGQVLGFVAEDLVGGAEVEVALQPVGGEGEQVVKRALGARDLVLPALGGVSDITADNAIDLVLPGHAPALRWAVRWISEVEQIPVRS